MGANWATADRGGRSEHELHAARDGVGLSEFYCGDVHPESSRRLLGCKHILHTLDLVYFAGCKLNKPMATVFSSKAGNTEKEKGREREREMLCFAT